MENTKAICNRLCIGYCYHGSPPQLPINHSFQMCLQLICHLTVNDTSILGVIREQEQYNNDMSSNNDTIHWESINDSSCRLRGPELYRLDTEVDTKYSIPINGYISPLLVLVTVINNTLVCIVLLKRNMRSPTNAILVAMALSDMFTGLVPTPVFLYFFTTDRVFDYVPYEWCTASKILLDYIPTIFHTASIWLTLALAVQRYIYVCHSFKARTWCTINNVIIGTVVIYAVSILTHISRFFDRYPQKVPKRSLLNPNETVDACFFDYSEDIVDYITVYYNIYYWFRVVFIHLIPCVTLVVMNALLIYHMRAAQVRRMQLLRQNKKTESRKLKESNCTTLMLVAVVGLFLVVEFPLGILFVFLIVTTTFEVVIVDANTLTVLGVFSNLFILLSYPLNFFIYCGMSKQFRETFKRLFVGGSLPMEREYSQYVTPTENGKSTAVTTAEVTLL